MVIDYVKCKIFITVLDRWNTQETVIHVSDRSFVRMDYSKLIDLLATIQDALVAIRMRMYTFTYLFVRIIH